MTLSPGQRATIEGTRLSLQFTGVPADSRCPADAFCIQLGEAVAVFDASVAAGGQSRIELRTSEGRRSAAVGDYLVVLRELTPYPFGSQPIDSSAYRATLSVGRR